MFLHEPCKQCGLKYHLRNRCSATNAECTFCHQIGHFVRTCFRAKRLSRRGTDLEFQLKKQRDRLRMTEFLRRKDAMNLPFFDAELEQLTFNSALRRSRKSTDQKSSAAEIMHLQSIIDDQAGLLEFQSRERDTLKAQLHVTNIELTQVDEENIDLKSELQICENDLLIANNRVKEGLDGAERYTQIITQLEDQCEQTEEMKLANVEFKKRIFVLIEHLDEHKSEFAKLQAEKKNLNEQIKTLQKTEEISSNNEQNLRNHCMKRQNVLEAIAFETGENNTVSENRHRGRRKCDRCGSRDQAHPRGQCPANRMWCYACDNSGHFPAFCPELRS